ncbi:MAG TPA: hemerythrin domain-containing protein [Rhizomicrobium sp.]|jgi:hypothetical protein|nr:hemerythrin domain-containing protein [Rhizomicrobium sp.]
MDTLQKTGRKIEKAVSGKPESPADQDVLDTVKEEHDEVKELLAKLVKSESAPERRSLLKQIKSALIPHSRAEEKIVYDGVIAIRETQAKIDGEEGYLEHGLADKMLGVLGKIAEVKSPEFSATAKVLKELVEHHVSEEERNVWRDMRENFDLDARIAMNKRYLAAKSKVRVPA